MDFKNNIKQILREGIAPEKMGEEAPTLPTTNHTLKEIEKVVGDEDNDASAGRYTRVQQLLKSPIINHAGIMKSMKGEKWGSADDTERSLFRKKLNREKNEEGGSYKFDKSEIEDVLNILMDISKSIAKSKKSK